LATCEDEKVGFSGRARRFMLIQGDEEEWSADLVAELETPSEKLDVVRVGEKSAQKRRESQQLSLASVPSQRSVK
jgi:uncharacterized protein YabE (DUF348 family)